MLYLVIDYELENGLENPVIVFTTTDLDTAARMCDKLEASCIAELKLGEECYYVM